MSMPCYTFTCPQCGSHDLIVVAEIACNVIQTGDGEYETEIAKHSDWYFDRDSWMHCRDCEHHDQVKYFEVEEESE